MVLHDNCDKMVPCCEPMSMTLTFHLVVQGQKLLPGHRTTILWICLLIFSVIVWAFRALKSSCDQVPYLNLNLIFLRLHKPHQFLNWNATPWVLCHCQKNLETYRENLYWIQFIHNRFKCLSIFSRRGSRNFRQRGSPTSSQFLKSKKKKKKKKRKKKKKTAGFGCSFPFNRIIDFSDNYLHSS